MGASGTLFTSYIEIGYKGFDKVDQYMRSAARSVQSGMSAINGEMQSGKTAILDFTRAGSPVAFNTLAGSVELLKARIGSAFTPVILSASKSVQDLANWIKKLDPETKKQIATWTTLGVVGTGLALTVGNLALKVGSLGISVASFAVNNPLLTGLGLIAVAAGHTWNQLSKLEDKMKSMVENTKRLNSGDINRDDISKSYVGKDLNSINDPKLRQERAKKYLQIAEERKKGVMSEVGDYGAGGNNNLATGMDALGITKAATGKSLIDNHTEELEQLNRDIAIAKQFLAEGEKGKKPVIKDSPTKGNSDFSISSMKTSPYASSGAKSLDSAYGNLNNMALGQDDIQRKILQEQQQANLQALQQSQKIEGIFDMLSNAMGR